MLCTHQLFIESKAYKSIITKKDIIHNKKVNKNNYWHGVFLGQKHIED